MHNFSYCREVAFINVIFLFFFTPSIFANITGDEFADSFENGDLIYLFEKIKAENNLRYWIDSPLAFSGRSGYYPTPLQYSMILAVEKSQKKDLALNAMKWLLENGASTETCLDALFDNYVTDDFLHFAVNLKDAAVLKLLFEHTKTKRFRNYSREKTTALQYLEQVMGTIDPKAEDKKYNEILKIRDLLIQHGYSS